MRICADIGNFANAHYFKNFTRVMKARRHEFFITARKKDVVFGLLSKYQNGHWSKGPGRTGFLGKAFYIYEADKLLYRLAKDFDFDIFLSFGTSYSAQVSKIMRKPHLPLDDTDHARFEHSMYVPFSDVVLTLYPGLKRNHFLQEKAA